MSKELIEQLRELSAKRKPYATGAHGQMIGMESYRIVANGFALECIDEAAERIEELERERDAFYMDYRMKCDEEAKGSALVIIERDELRAELDAARAEIERLQAESDPEALHIAYLHGQADRNKKLAAEQAKNVELLEIAKKGLRHYENRNIAHGTRNPAAIALDEIAATPSDTSALEAIVERAGEVMRERCAEVWMMGETHIRAIPAVTLEDLK